jgi:hypothetical protein
MTDLEWTVFAAGFRTGARWSVIRLLCHWLGVIMLLTAVVLAAPHAASALRPPGGSLRASLNAAAGELERPSGTLSPASALAAMPRHFHHWQATIDPTGFPAEVAITLHGLDGASCRTAVAVARRIEGRVVVELEGHRGAADCRDVNDMTWRFMP